MVTCDRAGDIPECDTCRHAKPHDACETGGGMSYCTTWGVCDAHDRARPFTVICGNPQVRWTHTPREQRLLAVICELAGPTRAGELTGVCESTLRAMVKRARRE